MQTGNKVKRSYTIKDTANQRLEQLSEKWGVSKTKVIERLIEMAPDGYPEKRVVVYATSPSAIWSTAYWDTPYTGNVWIQFQDGLIRQLIIYVEGMTMADFIEYISDEEKIKEMIWKATNQDNS